MDRGLARSRQVPPHLVGGDRQDRREQPRQAVGHQVHRGLRRAARRRAGGERIEPILRHVGVERRQVDGRQLVDALEDRREVVARRRRRGSSPRGVARSARARSDRPPACRRAAPGRAPDRSRRGSPAGSGRCCGSSGTPRPPAAGSACRRAALRGSRSSRPTAAAISAPLSLITSCGRMVLPSDFDILRPSTSIRKPCVSTSRNGGRPRVPRPTSSELWNQPRCWSLPSRYMSAGHVRSSRNGSTASWLEPESNQTSRMSRSRSNDGAAARRAGQARR